MPPEDPNKKPDAKPDEGKSEEKDKFVPADAYSAAKEAASKTQSENEQLKARLSQLEADQKAKEREELEKKQEWEKIAQQEKEAREKAEKRLNQNDELYKRTIKKTFLKEALGGAVKDQYLEFADIDSITLDENGNVNDESLKVAAEKFREEHSQLIPSKKDPAITRVGSPMNPGLDRNNAKDLVGDRDGFHRVIKDLIRK